MAQYDARSKDWLQSMLNYSVEDFGGTEVRLLRPDRIGVWLLNLNLSPKTKQHIRSAMKQVLEAGVEWGYLDQSPIRARSVKAPKQVEADIRPFRSWEEVDAVASHAGGRYESLIKFACATGLRPEEWIALTWADVSLLEQTATINKVCVDGVVNHDEGKTEASFRTIHLQQRAVDALLALPQLHTPHDLIFTSPPASTSTSTTSGDTPGSPPLRPPGYPTARCTNAGTPSPPWPSQQEPTSTGSAANSDTPTSEPPSSTTHDSDATCATATSIFSTLTRPARNQPCQIRVMNGVELED